MKVLLLISVIFSEFKSQLDLIYVPTTDFPTYYQYLEISYYFSFTTPSEINWKDFFNLSIGVLPMDNLFLTLNAYSLTDYSVDFIYKILEEKLNYPSVAIGVRDITYKKYMTPSVYGYRDDISYPMRPAEVFSAFVIIGKTLRNTRHFYLGLGRGSFVGYGTRSRYLNTWIFSKTYSHWNFGLFGGFKIEISHRWAFIGEYDGRNLNFGVKFDFNPRTTFSFAITKVEHLLGGLYPKMHPRFSFAISYHSLKKTEANLAILVGRVVDEETGLPVSDAILSFPNSKIPSCAVEADGSFKLSIPPGEYKIRVEAEGYVPSEEYFKLVGGEWRRLDIKLSRLKVPTSLGWQERKKREEVLITNFKKRAKSFEAEKKYEEALKEWKKVITLRPQDKEALKAIERLENLIKKREKEKEKEIKGKK